MPSSKQAPIQAVQISHTHSKNKFYLTATVPSMSGLRCHPGNVHLPPIASPLVSQLVQYFRHVMMAIVGTEVVVGDLECPVGSLYGIVPLFGRVLAVFEWEVFERAPEGKLT